jgi:DNA polymerase-3 subunit gamma/tau
MKPEVAAPAAKPAIVAAVEPVAKPARPSGPVKVAASNAAAAIATAEEWLQFAGNSGMKGAARQLAENAAFVGYGDGVLKLSLDAGFDYLRSEKSLAELSSVLAARLGAAPSVVFDHALGGESETLQQRSHRERNIRQSADEENFMNNPDVQRLIQQHGAKLVPDSIRPFDE